MLIIGICGASGSGKSTLARRIAQSLSCSSVIIGQDCYYKDHGALPFEERVHINYDEPDVFDHAELLADVLALSEGRSISKKGYDYAEHRRANSEERIEPPEVLILEGIHMFRDPALVERMILKVYMRVDADVCLLRRIRRDIKSRGRDIDSIAAQYLASVKPMFEQYIQNYERDADFLVTRGGKNSMAIDAISAYLSARLLAERFDRETIGQPAECSPLEEE